jgi:EmrB/QacA subfamily drug resistance transporter
MTTVQAVTPEVDQAFDPALRRLALVVLSGALMTILDTTIVNVAIKTLGTDFHTSLSTIQWVLTGYTLALSMAIPITGWAVERFGAKTMWLISLVLFISGSVLCGMAWSVGSLIAFRVLQGLGGGIIMPVGQVMLARAAGPDRMGRVMAVVAVPAMLGPVLGPILGGLIVDHLSWRWMFYVNVPLCLLALVLAVRMLPRDTERNAEAKLDAIGLGLLSPGLAALVYGLSEAGNGSGLTSAKFLVSVGIGVALVAAFGMRSLSKKQGALLDIRVFRSRSFSTAVGGMFIYSGSLFGLFVLLPLYFQLVRHDSPLHAGLLFAPLGLGAMITMPISGRLTDRIGSRVLAIAGALIVIVGILVFTQIHADTSTLLLSASVFVVGLGHGLMMPAMMGGAYRGLDRAEVPNATTAFNILLRVGGVFGTATLAVVLQNYLRDGFPQTGGKLDAVAAIQGPGSAVQLTSAFASTFWWTFAIIVVALVPILLIPRKPPNPPLKAK